MNDQQAPPPNAEEIEQERLRQKADILETNLFKSISKDGNPLLVRFQINRELAVVPVIIKALAQLFPRLNIKAPKLLLLVRKLLLRPLTGNQELKLQKKLLDLSESGQPEMSHLGITMRLVVSAKLLAMEIRGAPPVPGKDGAIKEAFFDYQSCPGLLRADGVIDFREINKYPIVKKGDNLFFITPEVQGKPGMQYDGKIIPVSRAMPMTITLREGVERIESTGPSGKLKGYFIRAKKTGVVVLTRSGDQITDIEVRDALEIKRLDYSTGNIGTRFSCPISMKIDTICAGFKIRARGAVEVRALEGGEIETDSHARIHSAHPGSRVKVRTNIGIRFSKRTRLTAVKGRIAIGDELMDTRTDAKEIFFDKSRGIMSGNTLDAQHIVLKGLYFTGENQIYFGRRLFKEKEDLIRDRVRLREKNLTREELKDQIMEAFNKDLIQLSKILKTHLLLRDNLKALILAAQDMDYDTLYRELDNIGQTMNTKEVIRLGKHLDTLKEIPGKIRETQAKSRTMLDRISETEGEMKEMRMEIGGFLRRASTLKVFTPGKEKADEPALFIESKSDQKTPINIKGEYLPGQGVVITRE